jgi:hypothetical protein
VRNSGRRQNTLIGLQLVWDVYSSAPLGVECTSKGKIKVDSMEQGNPTVCGHVYNGMTTGGWVTGPIWQTGVRSCKKRMPAM